MAHIYNFSTAEAQAEGTWAQGQPMPQTERKKLRKNLNNKREQEKQSGGRDRMRAKSECYVDSYGEKHNLSSQKLNEYNVNIKVIFLYLWSLKVR